MEPCHVCVLVHGLDGSEDDWLTWVDVLKGRYPTWKIRPLTTLHEPAQLWASDGTVGAIAELAAAEIEAILREESKNQRPLLHCIGHSMGGIVLRGALRVLADILGDGLPELGHFITLSTPHLGVSSGWLAISRAWLNVAARVSALTGLAPKLKQLAARDVGESGLPYLVEISSVRHLEVLARFRHRTCVTVESGDELIALPSGIIDPNCQASCNPPGHDELRDRDSSDSIASKWYIQEVSVDNGNLSGSDNEEGIGENSETESEVEIQRSHRWQTSSDSTCYFPKLIFERLNSLSWQRLVVQAHVESPENIHVFLIAKVAEQNEDEERLSKDCVCHLADLLAK